MRTKIILICSAGATVASQMELAKLITAASKLECVEQVHCHVDGMGTMASAIHAQNGRALDEIYIDEAAKIPNDYAKRVKDILAEMEADAIFDYIPKMNYPSYWTEPKPVPYVNYSHGKTSKSKAKPARPMIRRTC